MMPGMSPRGLSHASHVRQALLAGIALLFVLTAPGAAMVAPASSPPLLLSRSEVYPLAGHLAILPDRSGALAFGDVLADATRFRPIPGFLNRGYTSETTWVRLSFRRSANFPSDFFLRLSPLYLDHVSVWVQTGPDPYAASSFTRYQFGDHHPAAERPMHHSHFVIPLNDVDDLPHLVYVRVQTTSTHNLNGWIYSPRGFFSWTQQRSLLYGGYLGIALVIALVNAIYALRLRDMLYGYYALFVFAIFATEAGTEGLLGMVWPAGAHLVSDYLVGGGTALQYSFFCLFAMRFFDTRGTIPYTHRFFQLICLLGAATVVSIPLGLYGRFISLLLIGGLVLIFYVTGLGIRLFRRGVPAGGLFLTSFMASNIGAVVASLRLLGAIPATWLTSYSFQVGSLFHMVLMTLALTERLHAAEEKALAAARESEHKAVELANEMTRELQEKQKDLEQALETEHSALERQVRFVEMVSHEYRTPLAIIRANLDILEMKACPAGCLLSPNLGKMKRALARLVEVVEIALGRERLDDAHLKMSQEAIPLAPFMGRLLDEIGELWGERRLELDLDAAEGKTVAGDRSLLKTAFFNLIDNAFKYSAEADPVYVSVRAETGETIVVVHDFGRGLATDERERVFEKYYRGAASTDTRGAGIGLYLVRRIVEQHGGRVSLASPETGGTVATVCLPLSYLGEGPDGQES
jgi:signal transduction histidine kinase